MVELLDIPNRKIVSETPLPIGYIKEALVNQEIITQTTECLALGHAMNIVARQLPIKIERKILIQKVKQN